MDDLVARAQSVFKQKLQMRLAAMKVPAPNDSIGKLILLMLQRAPPAPSPPLIQRASPRTPVGQRAVTSTQSDAVDGRYVPQGPASDSQHSHRSAHLEAPLRLPKNEAQTRGVRLGARQKRCCHSMRSANVATTACDLQTPLPQHAISSACDLDFDGALVNLATENGA